MPHGLINPPGARVAGYVRSGGLQANDEPGLEAHLHTTLESALAEARSGYGDTVYVLPGHAQDVEDALMLTNLVPGTRIIGLCDPRHSIAPTFTFKTATSASWVIDDANVLITGLRFDLTGIDAVADAFQVSAAGCEIAGNYFWCEDSTAQAVNVIDLDSGCTDLILVGNYFYGEGADDVTTAVLIDGAFGADSVIADNIFMGGWHASQGAIRVGGAVKRIAILRNQLANLFTGSPNGRVLIDVQDAASTGIIDGNTCYIEHDGITQDFGIVYAGTSSTKLRCGRNYVADAPERAAILVPNPTGFEEDGTEVYTLEEDVDLTTPAADFDLSADVPSGAHILSVQTNLKTAVTGATATKVGIGISSDPDKYGLTSGLTQNLKTDRVVARVDLTAAEDVRLYACDNAGAAAGTIGGASEEVTVKIRYAFAKSLPNA
jgi:hypothetical protein